MTSCECLSAHTALAAGRLSLRCVGMVVTSNGAYDIWLVLLDGATRFCMETMSAIFWGPDVSTDASQSDGRCHNGTCRFWGAVRHATARAAGSGAVLSATLTTQRLTNRHPTCDRVIESCTGPVRLTADCVSTCRWYNQLDPSLKKETFTYDEVQRSRTLTRSFVSRMRRQRVMHERVCWR